MKKKNRSSPCTLFSSLFLMGAALAYAVLAAGPALAAGAMLLPQPRRPFYVLLTLAR